MITIQEAGAAVTRLALLKHFPGEAPARAELARMLQRMVATQEQLEWLIRAAINNCEDWPGPKELRGMFCQRYAPADGIEAWSTVPGFTPSDSEARHANEIEGFKRGEIEAPRTGGGLKRLQ